MDRLEAMLVGRSAPTRGGTVAAKVSNRRVYPDPSGNPARPQPPIAGGAVRPSEAAADLAGRGVAGPGSAGPGSAGPGSAVTGPGVVEPNLAGPGVAGPGVVEPNLAGPNVAGPGAAEAKVVDPRFRMRWIEVRRAEGRRRLRVLLAVSGALLIPLGGWLVFHSPFMAVRRVVVVGEVHATPEQIVEASGLSRHPLMVDVDAGAIKRRVESLPWVASVSVVKRWPETVKLVVHERSAVAEVPGPGATSALVDPTGRVLAVEPGSIGGLVQLSGVHLAPVGRQIKPVWKARELLDLVQALQSSWIPNLEVAKVSPSGQLSAQVQSPANPDIEVLIGSDGQLRAKLIALDTLLNRVPMAGVVSIDVRVPGSPVLTRQS